MPNYSKGEVILVRYPFTDLSGSKVRPAVVVDAPHPSRDNFIVPLTSRTAALLPGEFVIQDLGSTGLNVSSAIKRGIYTVDSAIVVRQLGNLSSMDNQQLEQSLRLWLGL